MFFFVYWILKWKKKIHKLIISLIHIDQTVGCNSIRTRNIAVRICTFFFLPMETAVGRSVKFSGLKSREDLNGAVGIVQEELLKGRLKVLLTSSSKTFISVSRENLIFMQPSEASEDISHTVSCHTAGTNVKVWPNIGYFYPCKTSFLIPTNLFEAATSLSPSPHKFWRCHPLLYLS